MEITKKKIIAVVITLITVSAAVITILSYLGIGPISLKGASIKIEGLKDSYQSVYNNALTIEFIVTNDGDELVSIDDIVLSQILGNGRESVYPNVNHDPENPTIKRDKSMNITITIPAHEARGTTEFKLRVWYNDYHHHKDSDRFIITWY